MSFGIIASSGSGIGGGGGSSVYGAAILAENPLLYWRLGETSGTTTTDSSGSGRDGMYLNSPGLDDYSILADNDGRSVYFDNSFQQRAYGTYGTWMNSSEITITCVHLWNSTTGNVQMLASRYQDENTDVSWFLYRENDEYKFYYRGSGGQGVTISSGVIGEMGKTYYVSAYAGAGGAGIRIYHQGVLVGNVTGAGHPVNSSTRPFVVAGCDSMTTYIFHGNMQEVAYFGTALPTATIDTLAAIATAPAPQWINRSAGVAARNGTSDHTLTFPATSAGSFLLAVVSGSVTSTAVTAGWTKRLSSVLDTEYAVFTRSANAGETSLTLTHNGTNCPVNYAVYEFPAGTSWVGGATQPNGNTPDLAGLPGTPVTVFSGFGMASQSPANPTASIEWGWRWFEDVDIMTINDGVTDGAYTTLGWRRGITDTSISPATTGFFGPVYTVTNPINNSTGVTFALHIP